MIPKERLGPRIKLGPFEIGNRYGKEIKTGEAVYFNQGADRYGGFGEAARVVNDGTDPQNPEAIVEHQLWWEEGGIPAGKLLATFRGKRINSSSVKRRIRLVRL